MPSLLSLPLWLIASTAVATPAASVDARQLARFARAWSVQFAEIEAPAAPPSSEENQRLELSRQLEGLLDSARTALGALRAEEAQRALADADGVLRAHPELPQSAWWMAECYRLRAEVAATHSSALALEFDTAAFALEGPRASSFRAHSESFTPPPAQIIELTGLTPRDRVEWDGQEQHGAIRSLSGEHHLRVLRAERLIWSGWVTLSAQTHTLPLSLPPIEPCSADDLVATAMDSERPIPAADTRCGDYAVARWQTGNFELARCHRTQCEAFRTQPPLPAPVKPWAQTTAPLVPLKPHAARWPWYLAGSVAFTAGAVLAGALATQGHAEPTERWRYDGLK